MQLRGRLNDILVKHTGTSLERVQKDTERDYFMSADQAQEYGIIDEVMRPRKTEQ
jgi:ATP-dependent Clp protease protease subunit